RRAFGPPLYPPLAGPLTGATVFGIREAPDPEAPVTCGQHAGHIRLGPPRDGCVTPAHRDHRSRSARGNACTRPSPSRTRPAWPLEELNPPECEFRWIRTAPS